MMTLKSRDPDGHRKACAVRCANWMSQSSMKPKLIGQPLLIPASCGLVVSIRSLVLLHMESALIGKALARDK